MYVILQGLVGSTAYGLATDQSDEDRLGVYMASNEEVLGLDAAKAITGSVVTHDPDKTIHELNKFLRLALACNPTITELLWLTEHEICTEEGKALLGLRRALLSEPSVRAAYTGYAVQQAKRLERRAEERKSGFKSALAKRTAKHGRHCFRLLLAGEMLLRTGELQVNVSDQRDELMAAGELAVTDPIAFNASFHRHLERIGSVISPLPRAPDTALVNATLIELRRAVLQR